MSARFTYDGGALFISYRYRYRTLQALENAVLRQVKANPSRWADAPASERIRAIEGIENAAKAPGGRLGVQQGRLMPSAGWEKAPYGVKAATAVVVGYGIFPPEVPADRGSLAEANK
mgnify:CR=1 FL=1|jgi:hypothetical protein